MRNNLIFFFYIAFVSSSSSLNVEINVNWNNITIVSNTVATLQVCISKKIFIIKLNLFIYFFVLILLLGCYKSIV